MWLPSRSGWMSPHSLHYTWLMGSRFGSIIELVVPEIWELVAGKRSELKATGYYMTRSRTYTWVMGRQTRAMGLVGQPHPRVVWTHCQMEGREQSLVRDRPPPVRSSLKTRQARRHNDRPTAPSNLTSTRSHCVVASLGYAFTSQL